MRRNWFPGQRGETSSIGWIILECLLANAFVARVWRVFFVARAAALIISQYGYNLTSRLLCAKIKLFWLLLRAIKRRMCAAKINWSLLFFIKWRQMDIWLLYSHTRCVWMLAPCFNACCIKNTMHFIIFLMVLLESELLYFNSNTIDLPLFVSHATTLGWFGCLAVCPDVGTILNVCCAKTLCILSIHR